MGLFKKTDSNSPDIIYTQEFRLANGSRYLDYMERKNAISPEDTNNLQRNQHTQNDPDMPKNYKGYLGYMDRKAATKMENDLSENEKGDYPTFTQGTYELSEEQHKQLVANLKEAQKNKSLLWAGVISFSPEFIEKSGLMNDDGSVNQKAIKTAVMNAMPEYLRAEGMDNSQTFWWGDIHLNTNHVHVHLAISQKKNTRPLRGRQPKGMFHTKSIRQLKSSIHHELANAKSRTRLLSLEQSIDYQRGEMISEISQTALNPQENKLRIMLVNLQQTLPKYKDRRRWRASNRSIEFRESRELAYDLVDYLLKNHLNNMYRQYQDSSKELDKLYRQAYGQNIKDTIKTRDNRLRERLVNLIFTNLREYTYLLGNSSVIYKKDSLGLLKEQGPELNQKIMKAEEEALKRLDPKSSQAKQIRMRLGFRRYYLKISNLDEKIADLQIKIDGLDKLGNRTNLGMFKHFYQEQQLMYKLQKVPHRTLEANPEMQKLLKKLQTKYCDVQKVSIEKLTPELLSTRTTQLKTEKKLIEKNRFDPGIQYITSDSLSLIKDYERKEQILETKRKIQENNRLPEEQQKKLNGPLFQELKHLYSKGEGNSNKNKYQKTDYKKIIYKLKNKRKERKKSSNHGHNVIYSLNNMITSTIKNDKQAARALRKRLDTDDDLEREDELAKRRERIR